MVFLIEISKNIFNNILKIHKNKNQIIKKYCLKPSLEGCILKFLVYLFYYLIGYIYHNKPTTLSVLSKRNFSQQNLS